MNYRACIIDDEALARSEMQRMLEEIPEIEICGMADSADGAVDLINSQNPDLVFLDIQLRETNAFDILEQITAATHIIFVTAYDKYATRAFEINALDYLLKPVHPERLHESFERFKSNSKPVEPKHERYKKADKIVITERNEYKLISINEITAICADGDYTLIHLVSRKKIMVLKSMNKWEELLPEDNFLRIHRGTIINMEYIERIEKGLNNTAKVYLQNAPEAYQMSQRFTSKFLARYKA